MTNFKAAFAYGLMIVGAAWTATILLSENIFGDLTEVDSAKPLWVIIPIMMIVGGFFIYKTIKPNK